MTDNSIKPEWSVQATPTKVWQYFAFDAKNGDIDYAFHGEFDGVRLVAYWDRGVDRWIDHLPEGFNDGFRPVYNRMGISHRDRSKGTVVVFQSEEEVDAFEAFYRENRRDYVAICFMPEIERVMDISMFTDRKLLFWAPNTAEGDQWFYDTSNIIGTRAKEIFVAETKGYGQGYNFLKALESSVQVINAIELAQPLVIDKPRVKINVEGFTDLRGTIPIQFIEKMQAELGDNKGKIEAEYNTIMRLVDRDPAFSHLIKTDRATNQVCFSSVYGTIDEVDNAILNRLSMYGIKRLGKDTRFDIINTLRLRDNNTINSVTDHFNRLSVKYPDPKSHLDEILSCITYGKNDLEMRVIYNELFHNFFIRAAQHTKMAFSAPVTNDIVPVFVGGQGIGKSRFCRYLAMEDSLFVDLGDKGVALGSPDSIRHISGKLVVELGEMSVYGKAEVTTVKAFVSQVVDSFRQLYERGITKVPRTANLVGTSNEVAFLKDLTGNRRFFPIGVKKIDHNKLFDHPEWVEQTWMHYWCNVVPNQFIELSANVKKFFDTETSKSVDTGFHEDIVEHIMHKLEPSRFFHAISNKQTRVSIPFAMFAEKYHAVIGGVPYDLNKKITFHLKKYGYEEAHARYQGKLVRAVSLDIKDEALLERMADVTTNPEEEHHGYDRS